MKLEVDLGFCRRSGNLVKESCHVRDATIVVPGCAAVEFLIELGAAHVCPGLDVFWEHRGMSGEICTLFSELFGDTSCSVILHQNHYVVNLENFVVRHFLYRKRRYFIEFQSGKLLILKF